MGWTSIEVVNGMTFWKIVNTVKENKRKAVVRIPLLFAYYFKLSTNKKLDL